MITLQYFDGKKWKDVGLFHSDELAWLSLGRDIAGYRTVDMEGNVITNAAKPATLTRNERTKQ